MKKVIFATLAICLIIGCMDAKKDSSANKENKNTDKKEEVPFDSIFVTDVNYENNIKKRFENVFEGKIIFNDSSIADITEPLSIKEPRDISKTFFISNNIEYTIQQSVLDSTGVVMIGEVHHPTAIGKIALKAIKDYKTTKSEKSKKVFFNQLRWVENNFYETSNYGFWTFPFSFPTKGLESGWPSVFSQGLLLNVCLEAYKLTGEKKYAVMIEKALKAYLVPVKYGGFMRKWDKQELWFEEYPTQKPSRVLNGNIYGLAGVYHVYQDLGLDLAKKIFDSGVETLKNHLEDWNASYSSRYSLRYKDIITKENYHEGHVIQLLWLYRVTGDEIFKEYAKIFLESDRYDFMSKSEYKLPAKIKEITADHTIDTINYGVEHLNNQIWAYGKYWSSYKKTDLIIDFGEKEKNIHALTLYHVSQQSKDVNFTIYAFNENEKKWDLVEQFFPKTSKDKISVYHETGGFETYIEHFNIVEPLNARKVKIVFEATNDNIIALREINFIFDRTDDLEHLIEVVDKRFAEGNLF